MKGLKKTPLNRHRLLKGNHDYVDITLNLNDGTLKPYCKTATSSNIHNRTILQEQNRIGFQVLTCQ